MDSKNALQSLLADLQGLHFSDHESRAYIALLKIQPATAYEVAKEAGLPKANSYSVLESLSRKEAVQPVSESPVRYTATPPDILLAAIVDRTEQRAARIKEGLSHLQDIPQHEYVWSMTGIPAIKSRISQIVNASTTHLWIKGSEEHLEEHNAALRSAADRGVDVLIVLFGTKLDHFSYDGKIKVMLHEGNGIPVAMAPYLVSITRDFEEALVADFGRQPHGSYTRNKPLVNIFDSLIRHEIYFCEIFDVFGEEIQDRFGPALFDLRKKYLPSPQVESLRDLIQTADWKKQTPQ
ncbi:TrmB family transcriptional regulator [Rhizobium sp. Root482]|uniref:TrmB family transcriptional regulator n=1 Tax=Rhizobium sp. Root482 TaxID=1736543 RepID=UPI0006F5ADB6|nr:TrmB family transcriptional regulator [Rhizobium sp. Root482]KQY21137.1 transcriptional regulator [Rhizobium sp. Root482]